jgi:hypothetical protein
MNGFRCQWAGGGTGAIPDKNPAGINGCVLISRAAASTLHALIAALPISKETAPTVFAGR